jgi:catechol 2,3-dioxygenase-like lactoylglutathione lyase family enzyme
MAKANKASAVGFNHIAPEVGDIDEALAFYGRLFDFKLRGKSAASAFIGSPNNTWMKVCRFMRLAVIQSLLPS